MRALAQQRLEHADRAARVARVEQARALEQRVGVARVRGERRVSSRAAGATARAPVARGLAPAQHDLGPAAGRARRRAGGGRASSAPASASAHAAKSPRASASSRRAPRADEVAGGAGSLALPPGLLGPGSAGRLAPAIAFSTLRLCLSAVLGRRTIAGSPM